MKRLVLSGFVLGGFTVAAMLVGCSGSQLPSTGLGIVPQNATRKPTGSSSDLIYVTTAKGIVMVSYPQGKIVGSIPWKSYPSGFICSDPNTGNVFVPEEGVIYGYAHGATTPSSMLTLPTGYTTSQGCALDPTTGNLAVSLYGSSSNGTISAVAIYTNGSGTPVLYSNPKVLFFEYPAYDSSSDLFVSSSMKRGEPHLAELKASGSDFTFTKVQNFDPYKLQWDGTYLDFSTTYGSRPGTAIDQIQLNGKNSTIVNSIQLNNSRGGPLYFWIQGGVVFSQLHKIRKNNDEGVGSWSYPNGGNPTGQFFGLTKGRKDGMGDLTVSVAPSR